MDDDPIVGSIYISQTEWPGTKHIRRRDLTKHIQDLIAKGEAFDEALSAIRFATFCWDEGDSRQGMEHLQDFLAKYNAEGSL